MSELRERLRRCYRSLVVGSQIWPVNEKLVEVVKSYNPDSVFEFGCGEGKNLALLNVKNHYGVDLSGRNVDIARNHGLSVDIGEEDSLRSVSDYDVVFTCSVLTHIPEIGGVVEAFKRIANKAVVLAETADKPYYQDKGMAEKALDTETEWRYFSHDYESYGFKKLDYVWESFHRFQKYHIYVWEKA